MTAQPEKTSPEVVPWADSKLLETLDQQSEVNKKNHSALTRKLLKVAFLGHLWVIGATGFFFMCFSLLVKPLAQCFVTSPLSTGAFTSSEMEDYLFHWIYFFTAFTFLCGLAVAWMEILVEARDSYRIYKAKKH